MEAVLSTLATLPNGKVVSIVSDLETLRNLVDGDVAYVPPSLIMNDPEQPRKYMDPEELKKLRGSIEKKGVLDPITVTPLRAVPWRDFNEADNVKFFFLNVAGHRRNTCALEIKLEAVPVRVRMYNSEEEHIDDRSLLNDNRAKLTALEDARAIKKELGLPGNTEKKVADARGISVGTLRNRMALNNLAPDILTRLNPADAKRKNGLQSTIGTELGNLGVPSTNDLKILGIELIAEQEGSDDERRFAYQRYVLSRVDKEKLSVTQTRDLIQDLSDSIKTAGGTGSRTTSRRAPRKLRAALVRLLQTVAGQPVLDVDDDEWVAMFATRSVAEVEALLGRWETAAERFESVPGKLRDVIEAKVKAKKEAEAEARRQKEFARQQAEQGSERQREEERQITPLKLGPLPAPKMQTRTATAVKTSTTTRVAERTQRPTSSESKVRPSPPPRPLPPKPTPPRKATKSGGLTVSHKDPETVPFRVRPPKPTKQNHQALSVAKKDGFPFDAFYWDKGAQRIVMGSVSAEEYVRLWMDKLLKFQREGGEKPDHWPTLKQAKRAAETARQAKQGIT